MVVIDRCIIKGGNLYTNYSKEYIERHKTPTPMSMLMSMLMSISKIITVETHYQL